MKRIVLSCLCLAATYLTTSADIVQKVFINGDIVNNEVTKLTFDEDNVILSFVDNSNITTEMQHLSIDFQYLTTDGIGSVQNSGNKTDDCNIYSISGQFVGKNSKSLKKGIYIVNGKKLIIK